MAKKIRMDKLAEVIKGMTGSYIALYKGKSGIYAKLFQDGEDKGYEVHWTRETPELVVTKVIEELTSLRRAEKGTEDEADLIAVFM